jgi:hypothetical protein
VIDAAGAIYVIGGFTDIAGTRIPDVWVSTDGGADWTRVGARGGLEEYCRGTKGTTGYWYWWYSGALEECLRVPRGYARDTQYVWRHKGTSGVPRGPRGVLGVLVCAIEVLRVLEGCSRGV